MRIGAALALAVSACMPVADEAVAPEADRQLLALLFEHARSIEGQLARDFACVSLRHGTADRDPPAALVAELASRWAVPVVPGSRCTVGGPGATVAAPGVSGTGKWLRVANLHCRSSSRCTADVSYYVANLGAGGRSVSIERSSEGWRIRPTGPMWIS